VAGCAAPVPVVRLEPITDRGSWWHGRWVETVAHEGLEVTLEHDAAATGLVQFDVQIANHTGVAVIVRPGDSFIADATPGSAPADAIEPEQQILALDRTLAAAKAAETNRLGIEAMLGLATLVADLATPAGQQTDSDASRAQDALDEANRDAAEVAHERRMAAIRARREQWTDVALRRTTLLPGETVAGRLSFRRPRTARRWTVHVRVGWQDFEFAFEPRIEGAAVAARPAWPRAAEAR